MSDADDFYSFTKLVLNVTNRCNLRCQMCGVVHVEQWHSLTREQAFHAVDFAERRGFKEMEVTGGEPTLVDYIWDLLQRMGQTSMKLRMSTNALRLTEEQIRILASLKNLFRRA